MPHSALLRPLVCLLAAGPVVMAAAPAPVAAKPTSAEAIRQLRVFEEPLVPVGGSPAAVETQALMEAIEAYRKAGGGEAFEPFEAFLKAHPASPWAASLRMNLGALYRHYGYFSRALEAWERAWEMAKGEKAGPGVAVADRALGGLMDLSARLGRMEALKALVPVAETRPVGGTAAERIRGAKEGLWVMEHQPEIGFRCGPLALGSILKSKGQHPEPEVIQKAFSTQQGTSLVQNLAWSKALGMEFQIAKRATGAPVLFPALVHWKAGHYAAVVKEQNGRYLVQDPTFGHEVWVSLKALEEEATGYALVRSGALPKGWSPVAESEAQQVWGKGYTGENDDMGCDGGGCQSSSCGVPTPGGGDSGGGGAAGDGDSGGPGSAGTDVGMAGYRANIPSISLVLRDTPLRYTPPVGPPIAFSMGYYQRDTYQPQTFAYGNFGPKWTFSWCAYLKDDPITPGQTVTLVWGLRGGFDYTGFDAGTQTYAQQYLRHDQLVKTGPASYELRKPDGSKEIYETSDGALSFPRRIFLSRLVDPAGNTVSLSYDGSLRLVAITDAIGQVSTLDYGHPTDPLKVTRITDPFGRHADFEYTGTGNLAQITDALGIRSQFTYATGTPSAPSMQGSARLQGGTDVGNNPPPPPDFITTLTTPYGTSRFDTGTGSLSSRWLEATDPVGGKERWEFRHDAPGITDQVAAVPSGFDNGLLAKRNVFFWDKRAMASYPGDYTKAKVTQFLHSAGSGKVSLLAEGVKRPLESRIWTAYPNQIGPHTEGTSSSLPVRTARVLEDGSEQNSYFTHNAWGKLLTSKDSLGRETTYVYAANGVDLLEVRNTTGGGSELMAKYTYNAQHKPLTVTDTAGQVTTFTYNAFGQVLTTTNAKGQATTFTYTPQGYLQQVQGPTVNGQPGAATTFTYDAQGRVRTVTGPEGDAVTTDYDTFDRPVKTTYSDGTTEEQEYQLLDLHRTKDRKGQWTFMQYNPLRQLVEVVDPSGRTIRLEWCGCGNQLEGLTDAMGRTTTWMRDLQGRVVAKIYPDQSQVQYQYDTAGRLVSRTDAKGQTTQYGYMADNNLRSVSYLNALVPTPSVFYTYDAKYKRMATMTDGNGVTTYAYHPVSTTPALGAGRLASVDGPWENDTITYTYDELGRVVNRAINGVAETRQFDEAGRLSSVTNPLGTFGYTYEGLTGRLAQVAYPNGQKTEFSYFDAAGGRRLKDLKNLKGDGSNISSFGYGYDANGQITTWSRQFDAQTPTAYTFTYDAVGQLLNGVLKDANSQVLKAYAYGYDLAGNRTSEQIDDVVTTSTHNGVNQLTGQRTSLVTAARTVGTGKGKAPAAPPAKAPTPKAKPAPTAVPVR